jgi:hypothetical protein
MDACFSISFPKGERGQQKTDPVFQELSSLSGFPDHMFDFFKKYCSTVLHGQSAANARHNKDEVGYCAP